MDDQTFEVMDSHDLKPDEWVFSLATMTLGDTPPYYILGTAYVLENELEPSKVQTAVLPHKPKWKVLPGFMSIHVAVHPLLTAVRISAALKWAGKMRLRAEHASNAFTRRTCKAVLLQRPWLWLCRLVIQSHLLPPLYRLLQSAEIVNSM